MKRSLGIYILALLSLIISSKAFAMEVSVTVDGTRCREGFVSLQKVVDNFNKFTRNHLNEKNQMSLVDCTETVEERRTWIFFIPYYYDHFTSQAIISFGSKAACTDLNVRVIKGISYEKGARFPNLELVDRSLRRHALLEIFNKFGMQMLATQSRLNDGRNGDPDLDKWVTVLGIPACLIDISP